MVGELELRQQGLLTDTALIVNSLHIVDTS